TSAHFKTDPKHDDYPVWSADAKQIAFSSDRDGAHNIYVKDAGGTGVEKLLVKSADAAYPWGWSPDGQSMIYSIYPTTSRRKATAWMISLTENEKPNPLWKAPSLSGRFSPDGH